MAQLYGLIRRTRRDLALMRAPLLLILSRQDRVVSIDNIDYVFDRVSSVDKEKVVLERGGHILTEDFDKDVAFEKIGRFIAERTRS